MDAVKFLKELKRMCENTDACSGCPARFLRSGFFACKLEHIPESYEGFAFDDLVSFVEKWSAEHPVKTRLMDFLEKFPNASLGSSGTPLYLPRPFGYCDRETCQGCDHWGSSDCWNLPLEE